MTPQDLSWEASVKIRLNPKKSELENIIVHKKLNIV